MQDEARASYLLLRDSIWVTIGLVDVLLAGDRSYDEKALLMRTRGDLLGLLHVVRRAETKIISAGLPSPDPAA